MHCERLEYLQFGNSKNSYYRSGGRALSKKEIKLGNDIVHDEVEIDNLVLRSKDGDMGAFNRLVFLFRGRVYGLVYNLLKNDTDAWDVSQEVFIKVWKGLPKFRNDSKFYTWLFRIVHNAVYDWHRKNKRKAVSIINAVEFDEGIDYSVSNNEKTPLQYISQKETASKINEAIDELKFEHREVILLKEVNGLSYQEIADVTACSIGTVMSRIFYARKSLQKILKKTYDELKKQ